MCFRIIIGVKKNILIAAHILAAFFSSGQSIASGYSETWDARALEQCEWFRSEIAKGRTGGPYLVKTWVMFYKTFNSASVRCWVYIPNGLSNGSDWGIASGDFGLGDELPPADRNTCSAGNPILIGSGQKIQEEILFSMPGFGNFSLIYSSRGGWTHSLDYGLETSPLLNPITDGLKFIIPSSWRLNGYFPVSHYKDLNSVDAGERAAPAYTLASVAPGRPVSYFRPNQSTLEQFSNNELIRWSTADNGWEIVTPVMTRLYSADGKLIRVKVDDNQLELQHSSGGTVVTNKGFTFHLNFQSGRLSSVVSPEGNIYTLSYNSGGQLASVTYPDDTSSEIDNPKKQFVYEDGDYPHLLTGIIDEADSRYATWTYDDQGRAVSSEHAGGTDKTLLAFNADGSTTVTNPLGKQTTYHFADIAGARRVTQVEGHATPSCEGANQNYTYTPEGWLASKTDWKGNTTTFSYNTLGQEISRTEAFGTPDARTITTEWHPDFYVKTRVVEGGKETLYTYDDDGRVLGAIINLLQPQ